MRNNADLILKKIGIHALVLLTERLMSYIHLKNGFLQIGKHVLVFEFKSFTSFLNVNLNVISTYDHYIKCDTFFKT